MFSRKDVMFSRKEYMFSGKDVYEETKTLIFCILYKEEKSDSTSTGEGKCRVPHISLSPSMRRKKRKEFR
jgi:hypothetical protein